MCLPHPDDRQGPALVLVQGRDHQGKIAGELHVVGIQVLGQDFTMNDLDMNGEVGCLRVLKSLRHVVNNIYILADVIMFDIDARPAMDGETGLRGGDTITFSVINHEEAGEQHEDELQN